MTLVPEADNLTEGSTRPAALGGSAALMLTARRVGLDGAKLTAFLREMQLIRRFEERAAEMYTRRKIGGFLHLYVGEEAVATGAMAALTERDFIVTHYRDHGHALARGLSPRALMAELFGRSTGVSHGKGGSMHLFDREKNFLGGYAIVAGHLPIACGLGLSAEFTGGDSVCLCIFGDGAVNEGEFHEALNLASLWKLPVVFLCENNLYGMGTALAAASATLDLYRFAEAYNMPSARCDGMNVVDTYRAMREAGEHCRSGAGPYFLEAMTYRYRGHSMADPELYRSKAEVAQWRLRDPIQLLRTALIENGVLSEEEAARVEHEVEAEIDDAVRFADDSAAPEPSELTTDVYADPSRGFKHASERRSAVGETTHAPREEQASS